jgi:glucose-6-phosphate dehydrogenase assembly protein OpcA
MSTEMPTSTGDGTVPLRDIEKELARHMDAVKDPGEGPVLRARLSNLVIYTDDDETAQAITNEVPTIVESHPARVILLVAKPGPPDEEVRGFVMAWCRRWGLRQHICSEQVTLKCRGRTAEDLPYAVLSLLVGDLPTNVWWATSTPPAMAGAVMPSMGEQAQQVIYDSNGWRDPARGVIATAAWLQKFERGPGDNRWRVASDLNWRRLKYWRRILGQSLDPNTAPGALDSISEVQIDHGPHALIQAWELASWLASRLGWKVQTGKVQPGVEIAWQFTAKHGPVKLRIHRLPDGPTAIRHIRITCRLAGKPGALDMVADGERRIAVTPEGVDAAPRTVTIQPQPLAELVGRQVNDRERDPVFQESMKVAQVLAQSVLT